MRKRSVEKPRHHLFKLVNTGFSPSDYSNCDEATLQRTQLTHGLNWSQRRAVSAAKGFQLPQPIEMVGKVWLM